MSRIENEREHRRGPKDAVYGWTLNFLFALGRNTLQLAAGVSLFFLKQITQNLGFII
jgi:hypothetical protein